MASTEGLVPITRSFLSKFYDKYPFTPLSPDVSVLASSLKEQSLQMHAASPDDPRITALIKQLASTPPHKIDENTWRNREQTEEILFLFDKKHWPDSLKAEASQSTRAVASSLTELIKEVESVMTSIEWFQKSNSERIFKLVLTYMPQDFRSTLMRQQRDRSEKRRQSEVDALVAAGGSIHNKYVLLWQQQMDRRKQLAELGSSTGVYRTLVKWLVGVPQVLLDFVRTINDDHGPMEEQRERYGPPLYQLTSFALAIRVFISVWWSTFDNTSSSTEELLKLLEKSVHVYTSELKRYLKHKEEVFENSPFIITAEEAGITNQGEDYKEALIAAGKTHEIHVTVESEGSSVAWDFRLTAGKDVGFSVEFLDNSNRKRPMLPYRRCEAHQGNFHSPSIGIYKLIWDNSYSNFYKKTVRFKVDSIPPVLDMPTMDEEPSSVDESLPIEDLKITEETSTNLPAVCTT